MQEILQQFMGGAAQMPPQQMYGHLDQMIQQAPDPHVQGAIGEALQALGPQGFGQSVAGAAQGLNPQQQQGLVGLLGSAIEGGGGSLQGALSSLGLGGAGASSGGLAPSMIGDLASYALQHHSGPLGATLGNATNANGSGVLSLLGNPMVQRVGINLAQRLLSGQGL